MSLFISTVMWSLSIMAVAPILSSYTEKHWKKIQHRIVSNLEDIHIFVQGRAIRWFLVLTIISSVVLALVLFDSVLSTPVVFMVLVSILLIYLRWRGTERLHAIRIQLPDTLELIAGSLRTGLSIRAAMHQLSQQVPYPISQELALVERMQRVGISLEEALNQLIRRLPLLELKFFVFTLKMASSSGGNLSDALDRLATSCRDRLIIEEKTEALTAQGRLQAWVMCALPLLLAGALFMIDPASMAPLFQSTPGRLVLVMMLFLQLIGLVWIRRLIRLPE